MGLGTSLRVGPNLILHPTRSAAQPTGSQQMLATRLTIRAAGCVLTVHCNEVSHQRPQAPHSPTKPAHFQFCKAPNYSLPFVWHTLVLYPELLHPSWFSLLKGHLWRSFFWSPWNLPGLFFCYHSLGSKFRKAWAATYFSVFIGLMSVFPTQLYEGGTTSALSTSASHCLAHGLPAWGPSGAE